MTPSSFPTQRISPYSKSDMSAAAGAVKPELLKLTIPLRQFVEFSCVVFVVLTGVAVPRLVPVPRRQIHPKLHRRCFDLPDDVPSSVLERAALHAVIGLRCGPQTESIMMFGHKDYVSDLGGTQRLHPLVWIELCGMKHLRIGGAVSPFTIHKSVRAKMDNRPNLQVLPLQLLWSWLQINRVLT